MRCPPAIIRMLWGQAHGKTEHMLMHMPMRIIIVRFVMTLAPDPKVFVVLGVIISPIAYLVNRKMQFYVICAHFTAQPTARFRRSSPSVRRR